MVRPRQCRRREAILTLPDPAAPTGSPAAARQPYPPKSSKHPQALRRPPATRGAAAPRSAAQHADFACSVVVPTAQAAGPLAGITVLELEGIGPGPLACCVLADFGADVITISRAVGGKVMSQNDPVSRGKRSIALDLKSPEGVRTRGC